MWALFDHLLHTSTQGSTVEKDSCLFLPCGAIPSLCHRGSLEENAGSTIMGSTLLKCISSLWIPPPQEDASGPALGMWVDDEQMLLTWEPPDLLKVSHDHGLKTTANVYRTGRGAYEHFTC